MLFGTRRLISKSYKIIIIPRRRRLLATTTLLYYCCHHHLRHLKTIGATTQSFHCKLLESFSPLRSSSIGTTSSSSTFVPSFKILDKNKKKLSTNNFRSTTPFEPITIMTTSTTTETPQLRRRSSRLQMLQQKSENNDESSKDNKRKKAISPPDHIKRSRRKSASASRAKQTRCYTSTAAAAKPSKTNTTKKEKEEHHPKSLPRTKELNLLSSHTDTTTTLQVIGVDEAGRGPLAGPVVAAAISLPLSISIDGILDSKQIKTEQRRLEIYNDIVSSKGVQWAVAVVDAPTIDKLNILQGTLLGMKMAVETLVMACNGNKEEEGKEKLDWKIVKKASIQEKGCYVVLGGGGDASLSSAPPKNKDEEKIYHALIDGNKSPTFTYPSSSSISSTPIIKGDSIEYCIAAASILAKVTRDALMHDYNNLYPQYELIRHKGYPTAAHMKRVWEFGASPIHRRSYAPLKFMKLDEDGKVLEEEEKKEEEGTKKKRQAKENGGGGSTGKKGKGLEKGNDRKMQGRKE